LLSLFLCLFVTSFPASHFDNLKFQVSNIWDYWEMPKSLMEFWSSWWLIGTSWHQLELPLSDPFTDFWCKDYNHGTKAWSHRHCNYNIRDAWANSCSSVSYSSICDDRIRVSLMFLIQVILKTDISWHWKLSIYKWFAEVTSRCYMLYIYFRSDRMS